MLERSYDSEAFNKILNHDSIRSYVVFGDQKELDCSEILENKNNILLANEFGGIFFEKVGAAAYQAHTQFLPGGRGKRAVKASIFAVNYMFKSTCCLTILAAIPSYNLASKIIAKRAGFEHQRKETGVWPQNGVLHDIDHYILTFENWLTN